MKRLFVFITLIVALSLACSFSTAAATPTTAPTIAPTDTPVPPTSTPIPLIAGINTPLMIEAMSLTLDQVVLTDAFKYNWIDPTTNESMITTFGPDEATDTVLALIFVGQGAIKNVFDWPNNPIETAVTATDNNGRFDYLWYSINNPDTGDVELLFIVDESAKRFYITFPDGQILDLASFLG